MSALADKRRQLKAERQKRQARIDALLLESNTIVQSGVCPVCGTKLVRNNALEGWWQCGAYATDRMRAKEFRGLPCCHFQCFTK